MIKAFLFLIGLVLRVIKAAVLLSVSFAILFIAYKGNQPMNVSGAPAGMTYFEFMKDRVNAAKEVEPSRCGWDCLFLWASWTPSIPLCILMLRRSCPSG